MSTSSRPGIDAGGNRGPSPATADPSEVITLAEFAVMIEEAVRSYNADRQVNGSASWPRRLRSRTSTFRPTRRSQPGFAL